MANAFISYSSKDRSIALTIAELLEKKGHRIWLDQKVINTGSQWDTSITDGLDSARALILLLSPNSVKSEYVKQEYSYACGMKLQILPVIIKALILPEEWKFNLSRTQILFYEADPKDTIDKIAKTLSDTDQTIYLPGEVVDTLINNQISIISFWMKKLVENGSAQKGDFVIFGADHEKNIYIQVAKNADGSLHVEASGKLTPPLELDENQKKALLNTGWSFPSDMNYFRTLWIRDKTELDNAANLVLLTLMTVYKIDPDESITVQHSLN